MPDLCTLYASPSGQGFIPIFTDSTTGLPVMVHSIVDGNAKQSLTLAGNPSGGSFAVSFGGQTSAPIPALPSPPASYFQWNGTLPATGQYDLAVNIFQAGPYSPAQLYEIFDGTTLLGTFQLNLSGVGSVVNPTPFADPGGLQRYDLTGPILWYPLGRFTFASTAMHVRISCDGTNVDGRNTTIIDNLRIVQVGPGTVTRFDTGQPPATLVSGSYGTGATAYMCADNTHLAIEMLGQGAGVRYLVDGPTFQSAVQAMSSVGSGNALYTTGNASVLAPLKFSLVGALGGVAQPLFTCPDGAVTIAQTAPGGVLPIVTRAGSPIPLRPDRLHYYATHPSMPGAFFPLHQAAPPARYESFFYHDNTYTGGWQQFSVTYGGYASNSYFSTDNPGSTATYVYRPIPAGTYRVSFTWVAASGQSTDVVYTVRDLASNVLGTYHVNQTLAPSGAVDQGVPWQIGGSFTFTGLDNGFLVVQSNATSAPMVGDTVRFERTSADDSVRIAPGDVLTWQAGAGWATTTNGPAPAIPAGTPVVNRVGGTLHDSLPASVTMAIGVNIEGVDVSSGNFLYNNYLSHCYDLRAWPTVLPASSYSYVLNFAQPSRGADNRTWPNVPAGHKILAWDGTSDLRISTQSGSASEYAASNYPAPGGIGNRRYYDFQGGGYAYGPSCFFVLYGTTLIGSGPTWNANISNAVLCDADLDPTALPKFRANYLARFNGMKSIRMMDMSGAIGNNGTDFGDYNPPDAWITKGTPVRTLVVPVHTMSQYTGSAVVLDRNRAQVLLITTTAPHGLARDQHAQVLNSSPYVINLTNDLGHTATVDLDGAFTFIYPVDATSFVIFLGAGCEKTGPPGAEVAHPWTMVGTLTDPPTTIKMEAGRGTPLRDIVELCNLAGGTGVSMHWNMNFAATDACCYEFGTFVGTHLNPGLKLRFSCSNETWNYQNSPYGCASAGSFALGESSDNAIPYTCVRAKAMWDQAEAGWVAAGRDPADFLRVMEGLYFDSGYTGRIALYCRDHGITFDEFAVAPYLGNRPGFVTAYSDQTQFQATVDRINFNIDQCMDMMDYHYTYGQYQGEMPTHRGQLDLYGFTAARLITYEGGPETMCLGGGSGANLSQTTHAMVMHPRWPGNFQQVLRAMQDSYGGLSGCTLFQDFILSGGDHGEADSFARWVVYTATTMLPYVPGNPTQDAIQINQFDRVDLLQSATGYTLLDYAGRLNASSLPSASGGFTLTGRATVTPTGTLPTTGGSRPIRLFPMPRRG